MDAQTRVVAIVGSYRRGGMTDKLVDELLAAASDRGADVFKIQLLDQRIEFCTNCRACTQEANLSRGDCTANDDMAGILDRIDHCDAIVLASPMNFWSPTALTKRFMERLVCYAYWPWGGMAPKARPSVRPKRAVVVMVSAAPSIMARLMTPMLRQLKRVVRLLGAKRVGVLAVGLAAQERTQEPAARALKKARRLGQWLAEGGKE